MASFGPPCEPIPFTRPTLPPLERLIPLLEQIWSRGVVTNGGPVQQAFEAALRTTLDWEETAVVSSGSSALGLMCAALRLTGDVVVSSFTHAATVQALLSRGLRPIYADIEPGGLTADPGSVLAALTPATSAILVTHTLGYAADVSALQQVATRHGVSLLFDAAAAVGVRYREHSLANYGDASAFSFHATKLLSTIEGGAVASRHPEVIERVRSLRNFGMSTAENADPQGTNAKTNELLSAVGLLALQGLSDEIQKRGRDLDTYRAQLADLESVQFPMLREHETSNNAYCVIRARAPNGAPLGKTVHDVLLRNAVESRRYFAGRYALAAVAGQAPRADAARTDVVCLPLWGGMAPEQIRRVCDLVRAAVASV